MTRYHGYRRSNWRKPESRNSWSGIKKNLETESDKTEFYRSFQTVSVKAKFGKTDFGKTEFWSRSCQTFIFPVFSDSLIISLLDSVLFFQLQKKVKTFLKVIIVEDTPPHGRSTMRRKGVKSVGLK